MTPHDLTSGVPLPLLAGLAMAAFTAPATADCGCIADLDGDCDVDGADLGLLMGAWDTPDADLTGDGTTDECDLSLLITETGCTDGNGALELGGEGSMAFTIVAVDNALAAPDEHHPEFDGQVTHFTFDLCVVTTGDADWLRAEMDATLDGTYTFFQHDLGQELEWPPDATLFDGAPALEFDSYWSGADVIGPGESGKSGMSYADIDGDHGDFEVEPQFLSHHWGDFDVLGPGTYTIMRFTVALPTGDGLSACTPIEIVPSGSAPPSQVIGDVTGVGYCTLDPCAPFAFAFEIIIASTLDWIGPDGGSILVGEHWSPAGSVDDSYLRIVNPTDGENVAELPAGTSAWPRSMIVASEASGEQTLRLDDESELALSSPMCGGLVGDGGRLELRNNAELSGEQLEITVGGRLTGGGHVSTELVNAGTIQPDSAAWGQMQLQEPVFQVGEILLDTDDDLLVSQILVNESDAIIDITNAILRVPNGLVNRSGHASDPPQEGDPIGVALAGATIDAGLEGFVNEEGGYVRGWGEIHADLDNREASVVYFTQPFEESKIIGCLMNEGTIYIGSCHALIVFPCGPIGGTIWGTFEGCTGPLESGATLLVGGHLAMTADSALGLPGGELTLTGDLDIAIDELQRLDLATTTVRLSSYAFEGTQRIEIMSPNVGAEVDPLEVPFAIGELVIGPLPGDYDLVDEHSNAGGAEAIYTSHLVLEPEVMLDLAGQTVYYETSSPPDPTGQVFDSVGGGELIKIIGGSFCPADLDASGAVDGADLGLLLAGWGSGGSADLDGDGTVGGSDLGLLLGAWGTCP